MRLRLNSEHQQLPHQRGNRLLPILRDPAEPIMDIDRQPDRDAGQRFLNPRTAAAWRRMFLSLLAHAFPLAPMNNI